MGAQAAYCKMFFKKHSLQASGHDIKDHGKSFEFDVPVKTSPPRRAVAAVYFRAEIEKAVAEGVARENMTLRLTLGDVSQLQRDGSVPVADISYAGGAMRYLGVKVEQGGVAESVLTRDA